MTFISGSHSRTYLPQQPSRNMPCPLSLEPRNSLGYAYDLRPPANLIIPHPSSCSLPTVQLARRSIGLGKFITYCHRHKKKIISDMMTQLFSLCGRKSEHLVLFFRWGTLKSANSRRVPCFARGARARAISVNLHGSRVCANSR